MRLSSVDRLRCPLCLAQGVESRYELDPTRIGGGEDGGPAGELLEGYLVCLRCRAARPLVTGIPIVVADLAPHLRDHGNVYRRVPIADPRVTRFVLGLAGHGGDVVPFEEVVERYGDLLPAKDDMPARSVSAYDTWLASDLAESRGVRGLALEIGCGVGRGVFTLAERFGDATGVDRSVARVRRARNVQTAEEFLLPSRPGARVETPISLSRLHRVDVDFVVAGAERLPFANASFAFVVLRDGDGVGSWTDAEAVRVEARRVLAPDGRLVESPVSSSPLAGLAEVPDDDGPLVA